MICPNCQSNVSDKRKHCDHCGADLTLYRKILTASNLYYNNGLSRAKVRDLSGAIIALKNSLELNKQNTNARNLLGLIYFEMGETVAALSEWVISRHFKPEDNDADEYINSVQNNPTKLDSLSQAVKRYNTALTFSKQGSDDLAIIQLKRVLTLNPHFIRAYQLLALLYMKSGDNERAKKYLVKAQRIDVSNTTTLRYLGELEPPAGAAKSPDGNPDAAEAKPTSSIVPLSSYKEDKPNIMAYVNLVIGVVVGLAIFAVLVLPSLKKKQTANENKSYVDYNAGLVSLQEKEATINSLEQDKQDLEKKVSDLQTQIDSIQVPEKNPDLYNALFTAVTQYMSELTKKEKDRDLTGIADSLLKIDTTKFESDTAKQLYDKLKTDIFPKVSDAYYSSGKKLYDRAKYEDALKDLTKSYEFDSANVDALYFMARSNHQLKNYDKATELYNKIITDFADSDRASLSKGKLNEIPKQ